MPLTPRQVFKEDILSPSRPELPPSTMRMRSDSSITSLSLHRRCMANAPDSRTISWVKLYLVRLMVTRGDLTDNARQSQPKSDMSPLERPVRTPVVTATGKGRRPSQRIVGSSYGLRVKFGDHSAPRRVDSSAAPWQRSRIRSCSSRSSASWVRHPWSTQWTVATRKRRSSMRAGVEDFKYEPSMVLVDQRRSSVRHVGSAGDVLEHECTQALDIGNGDLNDEIVGAGDRIDSKRLRCLEDVLVEGVHRRGRLWLQANGDERPDRSPERP